MRVFASLCLQLDNSCLLPCASSSNHHPMHHRHIFQFENDRSLGVQKPSIDKKRLVPRFVGLMLVGTTTSGGQHHDDDEEDLTFRPHLNRFLKCGPSWTTNWLAGKCLAGFCGHGFRQLRSVVFRQVTGLPNVCLRCQKMLQKCNFLELKHPHACLEKV